MSSNFAQVPYPLDFSAEKVPHRLGPLDADGIPMVDYAGSVGVVYNPVTVAHYALAHHQLYLENREPEHYEEFIRCAHWLVDSQQMEPGGRFGVWYYQMDLPALGVTAPWISGMAQGEGLSLLARAYAFTRQDAFYQAATRALNSFRYSVEAGGVYSLDSQGAYFYEEVAVAPPSRTLNGCLFALIGLHDFTVVWPGEGGEMLIKRGLEGVEKLLPQFDNGYWSRYSLFYADNIAPVDYHLIHIQQLKILAQWYELPLFLEFAERWQAFAGNKKNRVRWFVMYNLRRVEYKLRRIRSK